MEPDPLDWPGRDVGAWPEAAGTDLGHRALEAGQIVGNAVLVMD
jgi:hypothetical protein